jgi:hypothetical protein
MTPVLVTAAIATVWLIGIFFAWAFVHGAQKLRREEAAHLISQDPNRLATEDNTASVVSIAPAVLLGEAA